jgi:predicted small lipoprotein YifL
MKSRILVSSVAAAAVLGLMAGCGSSGGGDNATTPTTSYSVTTKVSPTDDYIYAAGMKCDGKDATLDTTSTDLEEYNITLSVTSTSTESYAKASPTLCEVTGGKMIGEDGTVVDNKTPLKVMPAPVTTAAEATAAAEKPAYATPATTMVALIAGGDATKKADAETKVAKALNMTDVNANTAKLSGTQKATISAVYFALNDAATRVTNETAQAAILKNLVENVVGDGTTTKNITDIATAVKTTYTEAATKVSGIDTTVATALSAQAEKVAALTTLVNNAVAEGKSVVAQIAVAETIAKDTTVTSATDINSTFETQSDAKQDSAYNASTVIESATIEGKEGVFKVKNGTTPISKSDLTIDFNNSTGTVLSVKLSGISMTSEGNYSVFPASAVNANVSYSEAGSTTYVSKDLNVSEVLVGMDSINHVYLADLIGNFPNANTTTVEKSEFKAYDANGNMIRTYTGQALLPSSELFKGTFTK